MRPRNWLVVTGTNGKTTTTGMLESVLRAAGFQVTASGNIGWPVLEAVLAGSAPGRAPAGPDRGGTVQLPAALGAEHPARGGVVLNLAEDHLDWHGSMDGLRRREGARADRQGCARGHRRPRRGRSAVRRSPAKLVVPVIGGRPFPGSLGVRQSMLVDNAFGADVLLAGGEVRPRR